MVCNVSEELPTGGSPADVFLKGRDMGDMTNRCWTGTLVWRNRLFAGVNPRYPQE